MKIEKISVEYSEHMGSDLTVVNAARQSFNKQKTEFDPKSDGGLLAYLATGKRTKEWEVFLDEIETLAQQSVCAPTYSKGHARRALKQRLIEYKREAQHWAPFGHPHVTLRLRMPIFLARQFVKHQVGGVWSEESRRYMDSEPNFYLEPVWMGRPSDIKQGAAGPLAHQVEITAALASLTASVINLYNELVTDSKAGHGDAMAPEQAREILTLNTMTGVTWTGSLLFWSRVCNQRLDPHAQGAANELARQISATVGPLFPHSWRELVGA